MPHQHGIDDGKFIERKVILTQYREAFTRPQSHSTVRGFELIAQNTHEGRFAGSVSSDNAIAVSWNKL